MSFSSPIRGKGNDSFADDCIKTYIDENFALRDKIKALNKEIIHQKDLNVKVSSQLENAKGDLNQLSSIVSQLQQKNEELQGINKSIVEEANKRIMQLNNDLQLARDSEEQLKRKMMQYQKANKDFQIQHMSIKSQLDDSDAEMKHLKDQLVKSSMNIKSHLDKESLLNQMNADLQEKLNESLDENARLKAKFSISQRKFNEQNLMVGTLKSKVSSLEEATNKFDSYNSLLKEKDATIRELKSRLNTAEIKCQTLTDALSHSQEKLNQMGRHEREMQALKDAHKVLVKRAEDAEECARMYESDLLEKSGQFTETIVKQNATIAKLTEKLNESQLKVRNQKNAKESLKREADNAKKDALEFSRQYNEIKKKCDTISSKLSDLSTSFQQSPSRVSDLQQPLNFSADRVSLQSPKRYSDLPDFSDSQDSDFEIDDSMKRELLSMNSDSSSY